MMRIAQVVAGLALSLVWSTIEVEAQEPPRSPSVLTGSLVGSDLFTAYCASCHGPAGKGDGPAAGALKIPPADLTSLARRHSGAYPAGLVRDRLTGIAGPGGSKAHGSTEMPVWGAIFKELDASAAVARVRVDNLVKYLEAIQAK